VNIFNFNGTLYGCIVKIEFLFFHRKEIKFANLRKLQIQIQKDILIVQQSFTKHNF